MAAIQRMSSVQVLPLGNYANGSRSFGPIDIASDVTSIDFSIARCTTATPTIWPNATTLLQMTPEISVDGGVTWVECGAFISGGGISTLRGVEVPFTVGGGSLPPQIGGTLRQFRGTSVVSGGPIRTSMTVEVN